MSPIIIALILLVFLLAIFGEKLFVKFNEIKWSKEKPDKIIGLKIRLREFDGLGPDPPKDLCGVITGFSDDHYHIDLEKPYEMDGAEEKYAAITARHAGYPISRISKRGILAVAGKFESKKGFIALISKALN